MKERERERERAREREREKNGWGGSTEPAEWGRHPANGGRPGIKTHFCM